jgi:hypothetical protein
MLRILFFTNFYLYHSLHLFRLRLAQPPTMGNCIQNFASVNPDKYFKISALKGALRELKIEAADLALAIDLTQSNEEQGAECSDKRHQKFDPLYKSRNLHAVRPYFSDQKRNLGSVAEVTHVGESDYPQATAPPAYSTGNTDCHSYQNTRSMPTFVRKDVTYQMDEKGNSVFEFVKPADWCTPYEYVMQLFYYGFLHLFKFDKDRKFPFWYFGDTTTVNKSVGSFNPEIPEVRSLEEMLRLYETVTPQLNFSGPTSFAPTIRRMVRYCQDNNPHQLHILVIVGDGAVQKSQMEETHRALVEASSYPISVIMIGVGDGPWDGMEEFDDQVGRRRYDNFQFVDINTIRAKHRHDVQEYKARRQAAACQQREFTEPEPATMVERVFVAAAQEIPDQVRDCRRLGFLD